MGEPEAPVSILISSMAGGGAQRSMLKLANAMAACGRSVDLVLPQATGPFLTEVHPGVGVIDLNARRVATSLPALIRYMRSARPRAMISALGYVNVVALWARRLARVPIRLIVTERNTLSVKTERSRRLRGRIMPFLIRLTYPWADAIVAVSHGVRQDLLSLTGLSPDQVTVIYNPIVTPELKVQATEPLDHPWFSPGEPPVILGVGSLSPQKDFTTLIQAFARVSKSYTARLVILGEGPERSQLESLLERLDVAEVVDMPGFDSNPYRYMSRAGVFVLSSLWEGLPGVLIEALACGVPTVATDCPSGPREILADGTHGALIPVKDVEAMAKAILDALAGKIPRPSSESWQPFDADLVVGQYLDLIDES